MVQPRLFLAIGLMLLTLGCVLKRPAHIELVIEPQCLSAPLTLIDCDDKNPPNCKKSIITYKAGCEMIVARKRK